MRICTPTPYRLQFYRLIYDTRLEAPSRVLLPSLYCELFIQNLPKTCDLTHLVCSRTHIKPTQNHRACIFGWDISLSGGITQTNISKIDDSWVMHVWTKENYFKYFLQSYPKSSKSSLYIFSNFLLSGSDSWLTKSNVLQEGFIKE